MSPRLKVALAFTYFYLVMVGYYILKPVRESFFLGEQGFRSLPRAHLMVLVATFLTAQVYARVAGRVKKRALVVGANLVFVACVLGFWLVLGPGQASPELRRSLAWVYFCWVSVFSVFAVTLFWSLTHSVFTPEEGSRYYGWVGAGGILGAMSGGYLTRTLAEVVGTENLLALSALLLLPCLGIGWWLGSEEGVGATARPQEPAARRPDALGLFTSSPYLCALAAIVCLTIVVSVLDDYRYAQVIAASFPVQDERTAFFGSIYQSTNLVGLFLALVVTKPLQQRFGPRPGMLVAPLMVGLSGLALYLDPSITVVFWSAVAIQSAAYSLAQFSRELLYLPCTRDEKFVAKGFIDTFFFRLGAGGASVYILLAWPEDGVRSISLLTLPLAATIAALAWWISGRWAAKVAAASGGGAGSAAAPPGGAGKKAPVDAGGVESPG